MNEEKGPRLVFADGTQSIYLADLSGDGLSDLVRIRNGEICYWPNLGYGHFGAKVTMDNSPWFDSPDQFDQKRIRLADTDGSGTTDIFYLRRDGVQIYFNQSGNGWSDAVLLPQFPSIDDIASIQVLDLLGNGTACLVWSSPLPNAARRPIRYLALMDEKPHLLVRMKNNLGAETKILYAPSTKFYLNDKQDGKLWVTRLLFPVHVVERAETYDWISRNRFVTRYVYHHGYFDGLEREFRGFGMVEQWDTEEIGTLTSSTVDNTNWDAASHVPPVLTKTWFHTGDYVSRDHVSDFFAGLLDADDKGEYYREPGLSDEQARTLLLPDTVLPAGLTAEEERQACRALKGFMLRQEVYALDHTDQAQHPYTVAEQNFVIERLQPKGDNHHAVFFTHPRETITYHYERNPIDPRIQHVLTLEVDEFGNVLKSAAIGYGRRQPSTQLSAEDQAKQTQTLITFTENNVTNGIDIADDYRAPLMAETRTYELTGFTPENGAARFSFNEWTYDDFALAMSTAEIPYEQTANYTAHQKRLIEHVRTLYRNNDLTGFSPLGTAESLALSGESYKLAFTPGLLAKVFQRDSQALLPDPTSVLGGQGIDRGGYVDLDGNDHWWFPSVKIFYSPSANDLPASELTFARAHFFEPHHYRDPFDNETTVTYDNHNLLLVETQDALGNVVTVNTLDDASHAEIRNDYRVLQPYWVTDPNGNRVQVTFDVLGMVVATAVMGKPGQNQGDNLINFETNLTQSQTDTFHDALDPHAIAATLLKNAGTRIIYDLHRFYRSQQMYPEDSSQWEPPYATTLARETHASDPLPQQGLKIQISFSYSDGFGREVQKKIQAEPGKVEVEDAAGNISVIDTTPNLRWVGSGWTIFNNKGKPVRQYEPFFSTNHHFQFGKKVGVSPILFYDPVERVVATLHPNHTYEKVVFDPWQQITFDVNDTVTFDPQADPDVNVFFLRLPDADYVPTWYQQRISEAMGTEEKSAAEKTAKHADTPTVAHFDTLGRTFLTIVHNKFERDNTVLEEKYPTRIVYDIEGNQREVIDAKDRVVMRYEYDMPGTCIHQASMEAGERWMLNDVTGKPIRAWDSRGFIRRMTYDELRRPTGLFVTENSAERLAEQTVYGEVQGDATNHRTRVYQVKDGAGVVTSVSYDFKGNLLQSKRELLPDYQNAVDWNQNPNPNDGIFAGRTAYDALNRPTQLIAPHSDQTGSAVNVIEPIYNEANLLEQMHAWLNQNGEPTGWLDPATADLHAVTNINYNAKGQRTLIAYGNDATTTYEYDPLTYLLTHLRTTRPTGLNGLASQLFANATIVQDLHYTYDPAGNITSITDNAIPAIQYNNENVEPNADYIYDAIYRLIFAHGREHIGQTTFDFNPPDGNYRDYPFVGLQAGSNDLKAVRNYTETYDYDEVGNIEQIRHSAANGSWTREYIYNETSLLEAGKINNRLTRTDVGNIPETYSYKDIQGNDVHGCMTSINLMQMSWDFKDQLQMVDLGGGGTAYYVYDSSGQRVRKVIHRQNGTRQKERIYLSGFEIYREYSGASEAIDLERETLHIMDDKQRVALVETKTVDVNSTLSTLPSTVTRYQCSNHLSSASLELDDNGAVISYEEYYPYGSTSYQAVRSDVEISPKRYRYTGKERDEESGLYYNGFRSYAPWLARWVNCDRIGILGGLNLYSYVADSPTRMVDPSGKAPEDLGLVGIGEGGPIQLLYPSGADIPTVELVPEKYTVKIRNKAEIGDLAKYRSQGAARWSTPLKSEGSTRLTEAEHPIARVVEEKYDPYYTNTKYRNKETLVQDRQVAIAKTTGDVRLAKVIEESASTEAPMSWSEAAARSKANWIRAWGNLWGQKSEFYGPEITLNAIEGASTRAAAVLPPSARPVPPTTNAEIPAVAAKAPPVETTPTTQGLSKARPGEAGFVDAELAEGAAGVTKGVLEGVLTVGPLATAGSHDDLARIGGELVAGAIALKVLSALGPWGFAAGGVLLTMTAPPGPPLEKQFEGGGAEGGPQSY